MPHTPPENPYWQRHKTHTMYAKGLRACQKTHPSGTNPATCPTCLPILQAIQRDREQDCANYTAILASHLQRHPEDLEAPVEQAHASGLLITWGSLVGRQDAYGCWQAAQAMVKRQRTCRCCAVQLGEGRCPLCRHVAGYLTRNPDARLDRLNTVFALPYGPQNSVALLGVEITRRNEEFVRRWYHGDWPLMFPEEAAQAFLAENDARDSSQ